MAKITFEDKENLNTNPIIPDINKVRDVDINEIKEVVNVNDDNAVYLENIKKEQTSSESDTYCCDFLNNKLIGEVLFTGSSVGNVQLSKNPYNYKYLEISFVDFYDQSYSVAKFDMSYIPSNVIYLTANSMNYSQETVKVYMEDFFSKYTISGNTLIWSNGGYKQFQYNANTGVLETSKVSIISQYIKIKKVVGYK